jgi:hypothetical protein
VRESQLSSGTIMKIIAAGSLAVVVCAAALSAQQPDSVRRARARADSIAKARADSIAAADSIALMRALAVPDTTRAAVGGAAGPTNPRLLPDISVVGDLTADMSPDGSTLEDQSRFGVREVELALQAAVDPYFRGDVFLGFNDVEGVGVEQAYLTATSLPWSLEARLGRFLMPFTKQNTTHRHDLHALEYPYALQFFLGPEGLKGTGVWLSRVFAPFGFYQELLLTAVDGLAETEELLIGLEEPNRHLSGLGYSARLRNYWDISESTNLEVSGSAMTLRRLQPLSNAISADGETVNAVLARQGVLGADLTFRWRPLAQGLYKSFILQAEVLHQLNERPSSIEDRIPVDPIIGRPSYAGPDRDFTGAYVFGRYQITRRLYLGARYDWLQNPLADGRTLNAGSGYLEWFPSEFSKLLAMYERRTLADGPGENRILFQAAFALGPHRPHPF